MTWTKELTIWCDAPECAAWRQEQARSVATLRRDLEPEGWVFLGGKDLCPAHRPKGRPIPPQPPLPEGIVEVPITELIARKDGERR